MIQKKLNIRHPIIQAPMAGGIIDENFVALVTNFGMLGSIPSGYLNFDSLENLIKKVKAKTKKPFQVNIFIDYQSDSAIYKKPQELIILEKSVGCYKSDYFQVEKPLTVDEIIQLIVKYKVPIISTTFGLLQKNYITLLKKNNVQIMSTVTSIDEMEVALQGRYCDGIIVQNQQAGGHLSSFLNRKNDDKLNINDFKKKYPQVYFIEAGGIVNKKDIARSVQNGYDGVQIGTGFLMTKESLASPLYKKTLLHIKNKDALIHTKSITGRKAKGVKNKLALLQTKEKLPYPLMHYATKNLRTFARKKGLMEYQSFWSGDGVVKINNILSLKDYMESLI